MGAPKGNQYAVGNNGGRPPTYATAEDLIHAVDSYFEYIVEEKEPATITGLTLYLGFCSRASLDDYAKRSDEFSYIIKKAKARVEHEYEKNLSGQAPTGSIFALKNMGWADKTEHSISGQMQNVNLTAEEAQAINKALENDV